MTTKKTMANRKPANTVEGSDAVPLKTMTTTDQSQMQESSASVARDQPARAIESAAEKSALVDHSSTPRGVRPGKTAPFHAGTVIKKHGMQAGVTPEMCQELCNILGHDDPTAEKAVLAWAWHALNGYQSQSENVSV